MVTISSINNVSPSFSRKNGALTQKKNEFLKEVTDAVELKKQRKSAIVLGDSHSGVQKIEDDFDDVVVSICNEYRKLPKGYYYHFIPKSLVYNTSAGSYSHAQEIPAKHIILKKTNPFDPDNKKMPLGYKLMNNSKGKTYIVAKDIDLQTLDEKTKTIFDRLKLKK